MDINSAVEEQSKRHSLEEMSKEELLKKCKNLLIIAQKAKQAKDAAIQENTAIKEQQLLKESTSQELIANITQQKLNLVTKLEDLKQQNALLNSKLAVTESQLSELDTENQSYKRQVTRLTDENDSLLRDLDVLENATGDLKSQISDLQERNKCLETANEVLKKERSGTEVQELQKMLSVSLQEVKKLQLENEGLMSEKEGVLKIYDSTKTIAEQLEVENTILKEELKSKQTEIEKYVNSTDDLNVELHKNRAIIEKLKRDLSNTNAKLSENQIVSSGVTSDLQNSNEKLKQKLRMYHSKLVRFAGDVKSLKDDRNIIMKEFKDYVNQVLEWKGRLEIFSDLLVKNQETVGSLESENKTLKEEINRLTKEIEEFKNKGDVNTEQNETVLNRISKLVMNNLEGSTDDLLNNIESLLTAQNKTKECEATIEKLYQELSEQKKEFVNLKTQNMNLEKVFADLRDSRSTEINNLNELLQQKTIESDNLKSILTSVSITLFKTSDFNPNTFNSNVNQLITSLNDTIVNLENQIQIAKATETQLAEKSSQEIIRLAEKNTELEEKIAQFEKVNRTEAFSQTDESDYEERISVLKRENAELLAEMNEMNQVLKERGETISKQQAYCDEIAKKLQTYEAQAKQNVTLQEEALKNKEDEIGQLQNELEGLRGRLRNMMEQDMGYAESENLSTSTYSRTEELNRLKDLEGSWEERYGKLRSLAIKLKGKIRELTAELSKEQSEKAEFQQKLGNSLKTVQTLQSKSDKLEDDLESSKAEIKSLLKKLDNAAIDISKDKKRLAENDETITKMKSDIEELKKEKENVEKWKKQVSGKVQSLKKELEANGLLKKDFEAKIAKLHADLEAKEQALKNEIEMHRQTKNLLQESNNECKKQSVLSLEMQDYERSVKELSQKLENKEETISALKNQIESQKSTINALREQNNILEERVEVEKTELNNTKVDLATQKRKIAELEDAVKQKDEKTQTVVRNLEECRLENEELSTELSKVIAEHQKASAALKAEKELLKSQNLGLEQKLREIQDVLKLKEHELEIINTEYQSYKIRAQSVLRQNQTRDIGLEEKLAQGVDQLKAQMQILNEDLNSTK